MHERLRTYTYLYAEAGDATDVYLDPALAAERAAAYAARGFTALKFDPAGPYSAFDPRQPSLEDLDRSARYVAAVREAVGRECDLLFGTHGQFTPAGAIRLARRLEPFEPLWLEEPVPPELTRADGARRARDDDPGRDGRATDDEARVRASSRDRGCARSSSRTSAAVGGILEAKKIAAMAEAHYAQIAPHLYSGPVLGAANIQLAACSPNFLVLEGILRLDRVPRGAPAHDRSSGRTGT